MSKSPEMFKDAVNPDIYFWSLLPISNSITGTLTIKTIHLYDICGKVRPKGPHDIMQAAFRKSSEPI